MSTTLLRVTFVVVALSATLFISPNTKIDFHVAAQVSGGQGSIGFQDLSGIWSFEPDFSDSGIRQQWYTRRLRLQIKLPGTLQAQAMGFEVEPRTQWVSTLYDHFWYLREDYKEYAYYGKVKIPFLSQPPKHYLGPAWYQREVDIPLQLQNRRVTLMLERPHWETTLWLDNTKIGSDRSLVAPHIYDLGTVTSGKHRLTIRIDNRMVLPYRPDSNSVSDSASATWNGILGRIELADTGRVWIEDAQVFPNLKQKSMTVKVKIGNATGRSGTGTLTGVWPADQPKWNCRYG